MTKRVPAMTARKNFGELLESVYHRGDEIIVERAGKPMGVLIPMAQYYKLERQRTDALAKIEQLWASAPNTGGPREDSALEDSAAEQEILEEVEAVRHTRALEAVRPSLEVA